MFCLSGECVDWPGRKGRGWARDVRGALELRTGMFVGMVFYLSGEGAGRARRPCEASGSHACG